jgi:hypothetical protein
MGPCDSHDHGVPLFWGRPTTLYLYNDSRVLVRCDVKSNVARVTCCLGAPRRHLQLCFAPKERTMKAMETAMPRLAPHLEQSPKSRKAIGREAAPSSLFFHS